MTQTFFRLLIAVLIFAAMPRWANAQPSDLVLFNTSNIVICPASPLENSPPDFSSSPCKAETLENIDPQNAFIWVKTTIALDSLTGAKGEPLSLYISGKMSSEVYLNGQFIGRNGTPGIDFESEVPGKMDAELFPPQSLFRIGENEVVFRASSHHGILHLASPVHMIAFAPAGRYSQGITPRFGPALLTFGLFILGVLYFGTMALIGITARRRFITLSAICLFAAGQLISEALRGVMAYPYPIHDYRLIAITLFSAAFGLSVAYHIFCTFMVKKIWPLMALVSGLSLCAIFSITGLDYKALAAMSLPLMVSLIAAGYWSFKRRPRAFLYFLTLLIFVISIFLFRGLFLDTLFFLFVAILIFLLFIEQALTLAKEARERRSEEARANRLELALAEAEERTETNYINVKSAGKMERIATSQILHCQGASGYSEIYLLGGRTVLQTASLNEMEGTLPATFLRVHRSHLINLMFVKSLSRDPSGTGLLKLTEGEDIPVSRRIMPKVRQALA